MLETAMRLRLLNATLALGWVFGQMGCAAECTADADCLTTQRCAEEVCVARPPRPPLPPAADAQTRDADPLDTGLAPDAADGGVDASVGDSGDGGDGGGGDASDAGPPIVETWGVVELSTVPSSTVPPQALARFVGSTATASISAYASPSGACTLVDRRWGGATFTGIDAGDPLTLGTWPTAPRSVTLVRRDRGLYTADLPLLFVPWASALTLEYAVPSSTTAGQLVATRLSLAADLPRAFSGVRMGQTDQVLPRLDTVDWDFLWAETIPREHAVVLELSDADERVVLRCPSTDRSTLRVPRPAQRAFAARAQRPFRADLSWERSEAETLQRTGGGAVPITLRHRVVVRYRVP